MESDPILLGLLLGYAVALYTDFVSGINLLTLLITLKILYLSFLTLLSRDLRGSDSRHYADCDCDNSESTAHLYQLDLYVINLRKKGSKKKYKIANRLGQNLIGDGLGDIISGAIGGPAGTNYGENISTMAITKNYSIRVLLAAAIITMGLAFVNPLSALVYSIPPAVIGGLSIYLFGVIGAQGITIMVDKKVNLFDAKNLSIIAIILIVGLGGAFYGGIPFFGIYLPNIATAAILGILLNLLYLIVDLIKRKPSKKTE